MFSKINKTVAYIIIMEVGAFLQCYKNPYATYKCLESFRRFYPSGTVVLVCDDGYNYSKMAQHFKCEYIHCFDKATFICTDLDTNIRFQNTHTLIDRIKRAFTLIKEDYVMWLEDDVVVNGRIEDNFKYDLNGFCPNKIHDHFISELKQKFSSIDDTRTYHFTGHGGSVYKKEALIGCFDNDAAIHDLLTNWKTYEFPTTLCQDFLFSLLIIINGGTIGNYEGHGESTYNRIFPEIKVQHQYKKWYGAPMPTELAHLVSGY